MNKIYKDFNTITKTLNFETLREAMLKKTIVEMRIEKGGRKKEGEFWHLS